MPGSTYNYNDPGLSTSATLAADLAPLWLQEELLMIAEKTTVFGDIGEKPTMPEGEGKTYSAQRYERLPLPTVPLTEGITPDSTALVVTKVEAMLEQWGMVVALTDVAQMTTKHDAIQAARDRLGTASAELQDREIQRVLSGSGTVAFPGGKTSRATLVAADVPTTDFISGLVATLRQLGAPTFEGAMYSGVIDPYTEQDLAKDTTFVSSHQYAESTALFNAEVGRWRGVRWKRSNLLPQISLLGTGASGATSAFAAPAAGETGFTAGSTVQVVVTRSDPTSGLDMQVAAAVAVTNASAYVVSVTIGASAPAGTYLVYVSPEGGTIATLQTSVTKAAGVAATVKVAKALTATVPGTVAYIAGGAPAPAAAPATGSVHIGYVFGRQAFAVPAIGSRSEATITPPSATDSDPLKQRRKAGFKFMTKTVILNPDFFRRFETMSAFA
jgi:N4-gp56 family major capsid protein